MLETGPPGSTLWLADDLEHGGGCQGIMGTVQKDASCLTCGLWPMHLLGEAAEPQNPKTLSGLLGSHIKGFL